MSTKVKKRELIEQLQQIDPYEFEAFIAELWDADGYETTVTQDSQDEGVDVYAERHGTIDQTVAIQAKRYSAGKKVGRPEVQQYASLRTQDRDVDSVAVVTTSSFTSGAKAWAYENSINLVDGEDLADLILKHNQTDLLERYSRGQISEVELESVRNDDSSNEERGEILESREKTKIAGFLLPLTAALALTGVGWVSLYFAPNNLFGWLTVFLVQWMGLPAIVAADGIQLKRRNSKFQPSILIWAGGTFLTMGILSIWYWIRRVRRTDVRTLYLDEYFG